jgi:tripartite-type tricarboxylate transporter receptor subunit TctC
MREETVTNVTTMVMRRLFGHGLLIAAGLAVVFPASAQPYPNRPIILVVPNPPGGTVDIMARAVADTLTSQLGQSVVVENRASGASGTIGARQVARATPDGYTLLIGYTTLLATSPSLYPNVGFDPRKDFAPIGLIASAPSVLVANLDLPVRNARDLIKLMKESPVPFQVGSPGTGSTNYLTAGLFARRAGVAIQQIPYKGSAPVITDLIGGHIKVAFNPIPVSRAAIENNLIRALAVSSIKRSSLFPDVLPIAESGLPGFDAVLTYGIVGPPGLPRPIIDKLNGALNTALATDTVQKRLLQEGAEPSPTTPEEYGAIIDREETQWSTLIKSMGVKSQ